MDKLPYVLLQEALVDIKDISIHYEKILPFLGDEFLDQLHDVALEKVCTNPYAFATFKANKNIRRFMMKRFPYKIFYDCSTVPLKIIAVIYASRSTHYIKRRLK